LPDLAGSYPPVNSSDFLELTFNSIIDANQLPLVRYEIDWGDAEHTVVSGVEMYDRPDPDNPHSIYHLYSYWDMAAKAASGVLPSGSCLPDCTSRGVLGPCCVATPGIWIRDNWNWCNNGNDASGPCPRDGTEFVYYQGEVVVAEGF
jgi:hypothetical protein